MFGIDDIAKARTVPLLAAGIAAAALLPVALPVIARVGRPALKSVVKAGLLIYEDSRIRIAEAGEYVEDLVAEAQAEAAGETVATDTDQD
jgi:hypothetical protein